MTFDQFVHGYLASNRDPGEIAMSKSNSLDDSTKTLVIKWLKMHHGDKEGLAKWMRDSLNLCGIRECRKIIDEATAGTEGDTTMKNHLCENCAGETKETQRFGDKAYMACVSCGHVQIIVGKELRNDSSDFSPAVKAAMAEVEKAKSDESSAVGDAKKSSKEKVLEALKKLSAAQKQEMAGIGLTISSMKKNALGDVDGHPELSWTSTGSGDGVVVYLKGRDPQSTMLGWSNKSLEVAVKMAVDKLASGKNSSAPCPSCGGEMGKPEVIGNVRRSVCNACGKVVHDSGILPSEEAGRLRYGRR
jgi:hypothetical protein